MFAVEFTADAGHRLRSRERWRIRRTPVNPALIFRSLWLILAYALIVWVAFRSLLQIVHPKTIAAEFLRLGAGVALLYSLGAIIAETSRWLFLASGYSLPLLHRTPIAARSVGEFWGQRWNILVSAWFGTFIFQPLARRGCARLGILCAFLVSGLFHGWPLLMALGIWPAFTTAAFFVIQGAAVLAENRLRIHTWPIPIARTWTVIIILASSPLFIDPGLRLFGL